MKYLSIFILLFFFSSQAYATSVYKCKDEHGKVTFSQRPCGDNADKIDVKSRPAASSESSHNNRDISNLSNKADAQYRNRKIKRLKNDIEELETIRDRKIKELRSEIVYNTENSGEGRAVAKKIQTIIDATRDHYDKKIKVKQKEIDKL